MGNLGEGVVTMTLNLHMMTPYDHIYCGIVLIPVVYDAMDYNQRKCCPL